MRFECRLIKARIQTHSQYIILIAFPSQVWLRERTSQLRYTEIAYLAYDWRDPSYS
jgi:hypothetical protein